MGKREIRIVQVPRWITVFLLVLVSAAMTTAIYLLSGHAYRREGSFPEVLSVLRPDRGSVSSTAVLASTAPAVADILFFIPWGVLAFLSFDRSGVPRSRVYAATVLVGVAFALALIAWQQSLPTRVTDWLDAPWNAVGCACGAALGHARKRVRIRFE
jgi:hypothetical protein